MGLFERSAENRIHQFGVIDAVIDLKGVMIHLGAAVRANHFWFRHFEASNAH